MHMRSLISGCLTGALIFTGTPLHAEMMGTHQLLVQEARSTQLAQVHAFMSRDEVRSQMEGLGVDPTQAAERVAALTDAELQQLAGNIEELPAGSGVLGVVLVVLVILILLELVGLLNIFPRI